MTTSNKTPAKNFSVPLLSLSLLLISSCATFQEDGSKVLFETGGGLETVVLLGTNDIHGALAPEKAKTKEENPTAYEKGGATILAAHVAILRQEFGRRLLLLDAGDQFQGSIDSNSTEGKPMVSLFNSLGLDASAVGNHEFDFGPIGPGVEGDPLGSLKARIGEAHYPYLAANIYDKKTHTFPGIPGTKASTILTAGNLKIGVIGLTTLETPVSTHPLFVKGLEFRDLAKTTIEEAKKLRDAGAQIIVIVSHAGVFCDVAAQSGKNIRVSSVKAETDIQSACDRDQEIPELLRKIPQGTVDAVVSGHTHSVVHHWIDGVPVIQSGTRNQYYNLLYLTYDWNTKKVRTDRTRIEGPIPVCPKVFSNQGNCNGDIIPPRNGRGRLTTPQLHGHSIDADSATERLLEPVFQQTEKEKKRVIAQLDRKLEHIRTAESPLGNLVADAIRKSVGADIAIVNQGGIRASLEAGPITYEDIYRTLPFDNSVSKLNLTGKDLKLFLRIAESGARGFFPVSGVRVRVIDLKHEPWSSDLNGDRKIEPWEMDRLIEATLDDGSPIENSKHYSVATIDFLVQGGDSLGWFMNTIPKDRIILNAGAIMRDTITQYMESFKDPINTVSQPLVAPNRPRIQLEGRPSKRDRVGQSGKSARRKRRR